MVSWKFVASLKCFYILKALTIQKSAASDRSDEELRLTEKMEDQASDAAALNLRQAGKENTSNLLFAEEGEKLQGPSFGYWLYRGKGYSINTGQCRSFRNFIQTAYNQKMSILTMFTNIHTTRITCSESAKVRQILWHTVHRRQYSVVCSGRWWRTGGCGNWNEICANCGSICRCNSGISIRPCIGNSNWGGSGQTCGAATQVLYMQSKHNRWQYSFYGPKGGHTMNNKCYSWKNKVSSYPNMQVNADLTMWSSRDGRRYTCNNKNKVNLLMYGLKYKQRRNEYCNGRWWRTGNCGWWTEICVGCSNICVCNSGFSFRPCINRNNPNWGGSWGHTCGANNQHLYFKIGEEKKTTTSTSTTTTTTTTLVPLVVNTWVMPEKSTWKITTLKGKTVCKGGPYTQWYAPIKVNCKLTYKRQYKIVCMNNWLGGWAGGSFAVKRKHYCKKYTFNRGSEWTETFTAK